MVLAILHSVIFIELELLDAFRVPCECDACLFRLKHISTLEQFPRDHKQMSMTDIRRIRPETRVLHRLSKDTRGAFWDGLIGRNCQSSLSDYRPLFPGQADNPLSESSGTPAQQEFVNVPVHLTSAALPATPLTHSTDRHLRKSATREDPAITDSRAKDTDAISLSAGRRRRPAAV
jgi:hypothetical protein